MSNPSTLGQLIGPKEERDAVHVAIYPATAAERLYPGQPVGLVDGRAMSGEPCLGIVDPFLPGAVYPGQRFWVWLTPGTITDLRHAWTHPALDGEPPSKSDAEAWLRQWCNEVGVSYETAIEAGHTYIRTGDRFIQQDSEAARDSLWIEPVLEKWWDCWAVVTGQRVSAEDRAAGPFCCTC